MSSVKQPRKLRPPRFGVGQPVTTPAARWWCSLRHLVVKILQGFVAAVAKFWVFLVAVEMDFCSSPPCQETVKHTAPREMSLRSFQALQSKSVGTTATTCDGCARALCSNISPQEASAHSVLKGFLPESTTASLFASFNPGRSRPRFPSGAYQTAENQNTPMLPCCVSGPQLSFPSLMTGQPSSEWHCTTQT